VADGGLPQPVVSLDRPLPEAREILRVWWFLLFVRVTARRLKLAGRRGHVE
jgi:hypothetical protein